MTATPDDLTQPAPAPTGGCCRVQAHGLRDEGVQQGQAAQHLGIQTVTCRGHVRRGSVRSTPTLDKSLSFAQVHMHSTM
jgi:hypothetical protein